MAESENYIWDKFTNQYSLSKTLRFELKPVGKTEELVRRIKEEKDFSSDLAPLILEDERREKAYKKVKRLIDDLHREFLCFALSDENISQFQRDNLSNEIKLFYDEYSKGKNNWDEGVIIRIQKRLAEELVKILDSSAPKFFETLSEEEECLRRLQASDKQKLEEIKVERESVAKQIKETSKSEVEKLEDLRDKRGDLDKQVLSLKRALEEYKRCLEYEFCGASQLYKKTDTLFTLLRLYYIKCEEATESIKEFDGFNSYFGGFNENRGNVYDIKGEDSGNNWHFKSTSIAHRLFEQNIKFHFDNIKKWESLKRMLEKFQNVLEEKNWSWKKELLTIESNLNFSAEEIFKPESFASLLSQNGIDKYNGILGGIPEKEEKPKVQGINELINLTRQKAGAGRNEFPLLQEFYKQILSERKGTFIDVFESNEELIEEVNKFVESEDELIKFIDGGDKGQGKLSFSELLGELEKQREEVYISKESLRFISNDLTGNWNSLEIWYLDGFDDTEKKKQAKRKAFTIKEMEDKLQEKREWVDTNQVKERKSDFYSQFVETADKTSSPWLKDRRIERENIFLSYFKAKYDYLLNERKETLFEYSKRALSLKHKDNLNNEDKKFIKKYLDASRYLFIFFRSLDIREKDLGKEEEQNSSWKEFIKGFLDKNEVSRLYNKVRNFLTKKEFSTKKFKLNFEKATLLKGFVESKGNTQYGGYLFRKKNQIDDYDYFLGMSKKGTWLQTSKAKEIGEGYESEYERLDYYQPKSTTFYSEKYSSEQKPKIVSCLKELVEDALGKIDDENTHSEIRKKVNDLFLDVNLTPTNAMDKLSKIAELRINQSEELAEMIGDTIDDLKEHIKKYIERNPSLKNIIDRKYSYKNFESNGLRELIEDLERVCNEKQFSYVSISQSEFEESLNTDKSPLYLFQITNKDLSYAKSNFDGKRRYKGKDNLHTMFFKALMEGNQQTIDIGTGEVFYRKASVKNPFTHKEGDVLKHKYYEKIWDESLCMPIRRSNTKEEVLAKEGITLENNDVLYMNKAIGRVVDNKEREIIKDRRYTQDKILLHLSVILNYQHNNNNLNNEINKYIKECNKKVNIIGIDRGERNLLYYTVINHQGDILEQESFNEIDNGFVPLGEKESRKIPYLEKLDRKEKERAGARENWETIENIKELKEGYLSQVVHQLSELIINHNAIVVLEDLNLGFKRGRFKVEKQVYQKFEKALIDKLNYLVFKSNEFGKAGHNLNGYQLTNKFISFQKLGKQSGILFYTTASYTSKTDPVTGYMQNLYPKYKDAKTSQEFFGRFDSIIYNGKHFEFTYDLKNLKGMTGSYDDKRENDETQLTKTKWTIHSHIERSQFAERKLNDEDENAKNGKWKSHQIIDVNQKLKDLFEREDFSLEAGKDYREIICDSNKTEQFEESKFFAKLTAHFKRLLSMRVTYSSKAEKFSYKDSKSGEEKIRYVHNAKSDFILSPVEPFYDSRKFKDNPELPRDSDANGAYNIARKGIMILNDIKDKDSKQDSKIKGISKMDWQNYCQREDVVSRQMSKYSS